MAKTDMRNSEGMLSGAYVGKIKYLLEKDIDFADIYESMTNITVMTQIIESIHEKNHVCVNDICDRIDLLSNDKDMVGSVLYAVSPLAFADIFGINHELDDVVKQIVSKMNTDEKVQLLCIEFIHLLHDILWFKVDKENIIQILPELDVLESEIVCSTDERDVFFAALWSFIFSDSYVSCFNKAANLENSNSDITGLACTFAGLYYGVDDIPSNWLEKILKTVGIGDDGTILLPIL